MRKYINLLANKYKMPFRFWSKAITLNLQASKQQRKELVYTENV